MLRIVLIVFIQSFLICAALTQSAENINVKGLEARVSVSAESISLDAIFEQLSHQTKCYFTYNAEQISGDKLVTIQLSAIPLKKALDTLLQNPIFSYELVNNQVVIHPVSTHEKIDVEKVRFCKTIRGVVVSSNDKSVLPFASVVVKNSYYGGITNENGEFVLKIPEEYSSDTLEFYFMGYHSKEIPISDISDSLIVELLTGNVSIQEVIIRSAEPTLLLEKARSLFRQNYYDKPYNFEAFYREAIKKGSSYRAYSEALLKGYKPAFTSGNSNNKVQIIRGRKYKNIRQSDTLLVKLRGGMDGCFRLDLIHELPDFLTEEGEQLYDYLISDIIVWHNELVYVINFKQKEFILEPLFEGEIYLSVNDQAIIGVEFSFSKKMMRKTRNYFIVKKSRQLKIRPVSTTYKIQYAKWNGKYYTRHVRGELIFRAKKKRQLIRENYSTLMEMVYTQIDTVDVKKPARQNLFHTHTIFSDSDEVYDDNYWKETNIINPERNIIDALRSSGFRVRQEGVVKE
ncbi:MAG: carboxypeptidase-like regulatory domain-containing protein [Salinivirgaceae bacterium]|nr:carboxypeptidase-like regulatory domain-containing protein [Salinivirgaceae bacterium]